MICGRLDNECDSLRLTVQNRPVWRLCFNWLRTMPNYLPFGKHKIDYGLIVADYQKIDLNTPGTNSWETCKSVAKIHYVVEGTEKIDLLTKSRFWRSEVNSTENSNSNKEQISAILEKGGFLVVFPGESFRSQVLCAGEISLKKVVISIPIQRVV